MECAAPKRWSKYTRNGSEKYHQKMLFLNSFVQLMWRLFNRLLFHGQNFSQKKFSCFWQFGIGFLKLVLSIIWCNAHNRPWWPSGLSRHSNSSRVAAKDPGLNPAWGIHFTVCMALNMDYWLAICKGPAIGHLWIMFYIQTQKKLSVKSFKHGPIIEISNHTVWILSNI